MPHFILEVSDNVLEQIDHKQLFSRLHKLLVEAGPFKLSEIKSRLIRHTLYWSGDGNDSNAFVHLSLAILEGRDFTLQRAVGDKIISFLRQEFAQSLKELDLSITVEIREMSRQTYFK